MSAPSSCPSIDATRPTAPGLIALAVALGARTVAGWSDPEGRLAAGLPPAPPRDVADARARIAAGGDPLGDAFYALRPAAERRIRGATYTPAAIVDAMLDWAGHLATPRRVVDPGLGSGRFAVEAGRRFPDAEILGVEVDPLAAILGRAHLAAAGLAGRSRVVLGDFRTATIPAVAGRTLYIGNPPYVRHHGIEPGGKRWLAEESARLGFRASQLAGLHVHFFLATAIRAAPGDFGVYVTAAEWLDVNYGRLARGLFLGPLGVRRIVVVEPEARPFPDAASTAAIVAFRVGAPGGRVALKRVGSLEGLAIRGGATRLPRARLEAESRWSGLARPARDRPSGYVELGELARVHRGQVTGANRIWIEGSTAAGLPAGTLFPAVTRARELFRAGRSLDDAAGLRRVVDLPADLDAFNPDERRAVDGFLEWARRLGADAGYIARNRRPWWSVGLRGPAPILATYMARRPPAFVRNRVGARHINIAHGLYPRGELGDGKLDALVAYLSEHVSTADGRTYAGGLAKFEPREMERLLVPGPDLLADASAQSFAAGAGASAGRAGLTTESAGGGVTGRMLE